MLRDLAPRDGYRRSPPEAVLNLATALLKAHVAAHLVTAPFTRVWIIPGSHAKLANGGRAVCMARFTSQCVIRSMIDAGLVKSWGADGQDL